MKDQLFIFRVHPQGMPGATLVTMIVVAPDEDTAQLTFDTEITERSEKDNSLYFSVVNLEMILPTEPHPDSPAVLYYAAS